VDQDSRTLQTLRRLEVALTATAHFAPSDSRLIEDAADGAARELMALGQTPEEVRRLATRVSRAGVGVERADLSERLRRAVERTLAACEQERRTPVEPVRAVPGAPGESGLTTTGEFRTTGEFQTTGEHRVTGEHDAVPVRVGR
jgi:hypothetical protein